MPKPIHLSTKLTAQDRYTECVTLFPFECWLRLQVKETGNIPAAPFEPSARKTDVYSYVKSKCKREKVVRVLVPHVGMWSPPPPPPSRSRGSECAMCLTLISFGQAASHSYWLVQLPKPSCVVLLDHVV